MKLMCYRHLPEHEQFVSLGQKQVGDRYAKDCGEDHQLVALRIALGSLR
jgi:hypothetical protein